MREILQNFLNSNTKETIPLQIIPIDTYSKILEDSGYEMEELEDNLNGIS